jgi:hypothetical protein
MAKKKQSPDQDRVRVAQRQPEKLWGCTRKYGAWGSANWPCKWRFWTNWNLLAFDAGEPEVKFHGPEVPESMLTVNVRLWRPALLVFWHRELKVWLGNWGWRKNENYQTTGES